jgi:hypothetical protein
MLEIKISYWYYDKKIKVRIEMDETQTFADLREKLSKKTGICTKHYFFRKKLTL